MQTHNKNWLSFTVGFIVCLFIRLLPFRPPNIEPILATQMPFSKVYGGLVGFLFAFLSITAYDLVTGTLGQWTLITASTYGVLGIISSLFFKKFKASRLNFGVFAVFGTLFFDAVTGLSIGPLFFGQSVHSAVVGQIPFTSWHLLGNVSFALTLSPALYRFISQRKKSGTGLITNQFKARQA